MLSLSIFRRNTINSNIRSLSVEQRRAFGRWYSRALSSLNMTAGGPSFIRDTGNLIVYLPFHSFQHLSPAQVTDTTPLCETRASPATARQLSVVSIVSVVVAVANVQ